MRTERCVLGSDSARADGVHSNPLGTQLARHAASHLEHRRFRRVICRPREALRRINPIMLNYVRAMNMTYSVRAMSANASNQDDAPSVAETFHLLASRLSREKSTVDVHAEDLR